MKITKIDYNNRRKVFSVETAKECLDFPYSQVEPRPRKGNYVRKAYVDPELGEEGFTYVLETGEEGSVHLDSVLEFNRNPDYLRDLMLYHLTLALQKAVEESGIGKRELIRLLDTSPSQLYRILDPSCSRKSLGQIFKIFYTLNRDLEVVIGSPNADREKNLGESKRYTATARSFQSVA